MAGRYFTPRSTALDASGDPEAGAKLYFYETGTSTPLDTYSDDGLTSANANPVVADSAGRFGEIFLKDQDYKVVLKTSADVTVWTADPVRAAEPTSTAVISKSTTYTVTVSDNGKLIEADATGGAFTITLPVAATAGDGFEVFIKKVDSSSNAVTVDGDGSETIDGESDASLPNQYDIIGVRCNGSAWRAIVQPLVRQNLPLPRGAIDGLVLSNSASDTEHDIDISAGMCRDGADGANILLSTAITKRIDAAWAVGTGNGGMDTGAVAADTWYYLWAIRRSDTGVVDALFSTSSTAPTMPSGYDQKRRIGAVLTNGSSNIIAFFQHGDYFYWDVPVEDADTSNPGTSPVTVDLTVPNLKVLADIVVTGFNGSTAFALLVTDPDQTSTAPSANNATINHTTGSGTDRLHATLHQMTDSSGQIQYELSLSGASDNVTVQTRGWYDLRGKDA